MIGGKHETKIIAGHASLKVLFLEDYGLSNLVFKGLGSYCGDDPQKKLCKFYPNVFLL